MKLWFTICIIAYLVDHTYCTESREDIQDGDVRLVGGQSSSEGRVEIYFGDGWGTVCDDNWGITDADVVCKQLGYVWAVDAKVRAYYGQGSGTIYLDNVECFGSEDRLHNCEHAGVYNHNCDHSEDAGVVCETDIIQPEDGLLRLTGNDETSGLLDIMYRGVWGSVCPDDFDMNDANVACRQLGFAWAIAVEMGNDYSTCWTWITDVECDGTESSILECHHDGLYEQSCGAYEGVNIACSHGDHDLDDFPKYFPVRLRDGNDESNGRVEVYAEGEWGTVCDKKWNIDDAHVVCRQLGYDGALDAKINAFYGAGSGPIHFKKFLCDGDENYLSACEFNYVTDSDQCSHADDAGVVCTDDDDDDNYYSSFNYFSFDSFSEYAATDEPSVINWCDSNLCVNGYCIASSTVGTGIGLFYCMCDSGWTGIYCDINVCASSPCENGASCISTTTSSSSSEFTCECGSGWTGTLCDIPINACDSNPCVNGVCLSTTSSSPYYSCMCNSGWTGMNCETDISVISPCASNPCVNGICTSSSSSLEFTCECVNGWTGTLCDTAVINVCASSPCVNGICLSLTSSSGSFTCECSSGWTGTLCDTVSSACDSSPCVNGICLTSSSQFSCECSSGWTGNLCDTEITACDSNPCINGNCLLDPSSDAYHCTCYDGYTGNICDQEIVGCGLSPCLNGGQCESVSDDGREYKCDCLYAWIGTHCETERNGCNLYPCLNNGECADIANGGYECKCMMGYSGENCEIVETACDSNPCRNGECLIVPADNTYFCNCEEGWMGEHCEEEIDLELECSSNPCLHGECLELSDEGYFCSCEDNWTGVNCQTSTVGCVAEPCLNGGSCRDVGVDGDYECDCLEGFHGNNCQTVESLCDPDPCKNGECLDITSSMMFYCVCDVGWTGTLCDTEIACVNNPCINAVTCIDHSNGEYTCICQTGWIGDRCDEFENAHTNSMETTINTIAVQTTEPIAAGPDQTSSDDLPIGIIAGAGGAALVIIIVLSVLACLIHNRPSSSKPGLSGLENQSYELDDSKPPINGHDYDNSIQKGYAPEVKGKPPKLADEKSNEYIEPNGNLYTDIQESTYAEIPDTYMELSRPADTYMVLTP